MSCPLVDYGFGVLVRALLSVWDKSGLVPFAQGLANLGIELISSGGTSAALAAAGIPHRSVDEVTGAPEMLDGRVKTLHPTIHGAILADRSKPEHLAELASRDIGLIDLVVCNLYPFESNPSIELIDVGGPTMVRAAAKNLASVAVIVDPVDYEVVLAELQSLRNVSARTKLRLAQAAFHHTASYDARIASWFDGLVALEETGTETTEAASIIAPTISLDLHLSQTLRYGENPHQIGARYRIVGEKGWPDSLIQHQGKELSYLNLFDTDAAWRLVHDLGHEAAAVVMKHANPCGAATARTLSAAYRRAHEGDPVSAFGGVVALNRRMDAETAELLVGVFTEVVIAPGYEADALEVLAAKKQMRVLEALPPSSSKRHFRSIDGGLLMQSPDRVGESDEGWTVVSKAQPDEATRRDLAFAWRLCSHVSSNAIVVCAESQAVGIGAGQQSRVDAARIAVSKAGDRSRGAVGASDAFFPFRDGLDVLAEAGLRAIIEPGGSVRDDEVIAAADEFGLALVFTGRRHFRH